MGKRVILVVIFDSRTSLGLVRLRVKRGTEGLARIFEDIVMKVEQDKHVTESVPSPFAEITEEDIDNLFR